MPDTPGHRVAYSTGVRPGISLLNPCYIAWSSVLLWHKSAFQLNKGNASMPYDIQRGPDTGHNDGILGIGSTVDIGWIRMELRRQGHGLGPNINP